MHLSENIKKNNIILNPGESMLFKKECVVSTILGSCVAVTFYDKKKRLFAITHNILPIKKDLEKYSIGAYVDSSLEYIINNYCRLGIDLTSKDVEVKIFGGSNGNFNSMSVGKKNVETALSVLAKHNVEIVQKDILGKNGRKILFDTSNGSVWVKKIENSQSQIF